MTLPDRIKRAGNLFIDRIDPQIIFAAVEYADFNECCLAVEILCEQLYEYSVPITLEEFEQLRQLATETTADPSLIEMLRSLVRSNST
ncbi:MafI family immunity protein [Blastopirellula sp. JC732]|uniref:MafI family immunity protein n=1 Tax=Blastopirellula sediminis TaxID=2894196 RepID=A0A9X1SH76_9BACT|nr:MafI family immunity protein [Blastopirellula sediminis]MCC9606902.1 MafI family immunity protein [Blastopirellula sediminis]MCC9629802.1 MafI family immunity protein [Blastopirellula sediminis]